MPADTRPALPTARWRALGTTVVLQAQSARPSRARAAVEAELAAVDLACSRFRPDSEPPRLNANAGRSTIVSPLLMQALAQALREELYRRRRRPPWAARSSSRGYDRDFALLTGPGAGAGGQVAITARVREGWRE